MHPLRILWRNPKHGEKGHARLCCMFINPEHQRESEADEAFVRRVMAQDAPGVKEFVIAHEIDLPDNAYIDRWDIQNGKVVIQ